MKHDPDFVLCECDLDRLVHFVEGLETRHKVEIVREPAVCLTMIRAEDSLEHQEFYLGEALTTECEVAVDGIPGYGLCLGEEPQRGYCLAVIDALQHGGGPPDSEITEFIAYHAEQLEAKERREFSRILSTKVDFKLMDEN